MTRWNVRSVARALAQPVTYLGIGMLAFIYCALAYLISSDRDAAYASAERRAGNLVRVLDQSFTHVFKSVDATLLFLRKSYQHSTGPFDLAVWVRDPSVRNELAFDFTIIGADGRVVDSSYSKDIIGADRTDREHFRIHANSTADELIIGEPVVLKSNGRWAITLSRRIAAPDGTFAGVVSAFLDPSQLAKQMGEIDLGPDGTFALTGLDGIMRTRVVSGETDWKNIGRDASLSGVIQRARRATSGSFWNEPGLFDHVSRLLSYRVLESFPMVAAVSLSAAEVYQYADANARVYWGVVLLLTAAILAAIAFGAWRQQTLFETTAQMKQAQTALEQSQERYQLVEEAVNDGIWDWNIQTDEVYFSPRWKSILGHADNELPNERSSFADRLHPDDRAAHAEALRAHLEEDKPYSLVSRRRCKDGSYRWVESRGRALRDAAGRPARMLGTITDINERKQAEALLEESRNNLARAEKMALLGHYKCEIGSSVFTWSAGVYHVMGKSPASFIPTADAILELLHPDDRPLLQKNRQAVWSGNESPPLTVRVVRDDGRIVFIESLSMPVRASDGAVIGLFGTLQDVTARKQAEAEIAQSRDSLARAEAMAGLGHYKYDARSDVFVWSEGFYRILRKSPDSFTPTLSSILEIVHPDDRELVKQHRRDVMTGVETARITLRWVMENGQIIVTENLALPVRASDGTAIGRFGTILDITGRKQAEAALAQANQELETRVAERTAELAQEMRRLEEAQMTLAQMQKMEAIGQLTAGIAHDFNNLLAVIGSGLECIERAAERGLTAEPELIDASLRATRRGRDLVQRLLAFARQSPLSAEPTSVNQLVLDTLRLLQRTLGEGVDIVTQLDATAAVVCVDRNQLANTLLNLALNARDAMPEGGVLTIATVCQPARWAAAEGVVRWPTGEEVCITVKDTGVGMTEDVRKRACEPFFTTKRDGLGSGLGLSMVQGFVEQSGGHIEIDSAPERGTVITIHLPRMEAVRRLEEGHGIAASAKAELEKTVLLVEDDPDVRIVMAAQLKQLGYKVHAVANGMEAIDVIGSPASIDVTLTDIVLPGGIDGVALVKEALRARPRMGVLCMSGYDPTQEHRKWLKVQNIEFLEKPFSSGRLAQALDAVLVQ